MGRFIFSVSYEIIPEKRDEYLELMKKITSEINKQSNQEYTLFEDAERQNFMTEVFFLKNEKDIDEVRRLQESTEDSFFEQISSYIKNQDQVALRTYIEII
ncbi:hypothetical protein ACFL5P_00320 [candidate division KSB1 bacterium]